MLRLFLKKKTTEQATNEKGTQSMHPRNLTSDKMARLHRGTIHGFALALGVLTSAFLGISGDLKADTNTFFGDNAGAAITTGTNNSGFGYHALESDDTGGRNTASGATALAENEDGNYNTAIGSGALARNIGGTSCCLGDYNTAVGKDALVSNVQGQSNTAVGLAALFSSSGSYNIALGAGAGQNVTSGTANIYIGNDGLSSDSYAIRIGTDGIQARAYMAGIYPVTLVGLPVRVFSSGKLAATVLSSSRFKENVQPMGKTSEPILSLQPVTFRYKKELDAEGTRQFGLVAEEVAKVSPDLVVRDADGQPYTVCYDAINSMLLNEFQKTQRQAGQEARETQSQKTQLRELQSTFAKQQKEIAALSDGVQRVGNELMLAKPAVRLVATNTALGLDALDSISTGTYNTAFGSNALHSDTTGSYNTANGCKALYSNESGDDNTATGREALFANKADGNTAVGAHSSHANTTGIDNTAGGKYALYNSTNGSNNIAFGYQAGWNLTSTGESNNILIGDMGTYGQTGAIHIGDCSRQTNAYMAGIHDALTLRTQPRLYVDSSCQLGIKSSSARFKENIESMGKASEALLKLRPVTFRYKQELDPKGILQFGLVAEEVAKIEPDLVIRDADGKPYGIRYEAVNAMLLNEFLKTHRQVEEEVGKQEAQVASIAELRSTMAGREEQIVALQRNAKALRKEAALTKPAIRQIACDTPTTDNTFCGDGAGAAIADGDCNSGFGNNALHSATSADFATAIGTEAQSATTSGSNVAVGEKALITTTTSVWNTAVGARALYHDTGGRNTAIGSYAMYNNTSGTYNIALGESAGYALTTGSYNIDIGNLGKAGDSNTIRIGTEDTQKGTFMAGVYMNNVDGLPVVVDSEGHLGTTTSSARFKRDIQPMAKTSEAILALRPVTFGYHKDLDPTGAPQVGLVAEEVAKVNPDLAVRDAHGKPYTVRYEAIDAMLLNEFLKLHEQVAKQVSERQAQEVTLNELRAGLGKQAERMNALRSGIQAIHFKLQVKRPAAHTVAQN